MGRHDHSAVPIQSQSLLILTQHTYKTLNNSEQMQFLIVYYRENLGSPQGHKGKSVQVFSCKLTLNKLHLEVEGFLLYVQFMKEPTLQFSLQNLYAQISLKQQQSKWRHILYIYIDKFIFILILKKTKVVKAGAFVQLKSLLISRLPGGLRSMQN